MVVTDPHTDHQPIIEASYVNIPVIAFCNTDSPLRYIDIAIPCNNKAPNSIGLMWWLLAREVKRLRGTIPRIGDWGVVVDLFFYRDPEETEKDEVAAKELLPPTKVDDVVEPLTEETGNWAEEVAAATLPATEDWNEEENVKTTWGGDGTF